MFFNFNNINTGKYIILHFQIWIDQDLSIYEACKSSCTFAYSFWNFHIKHLILYICVEDQFVLHGTRKLLKQLIKEMFLFSYQVYYLFLVFPSAHKNSWGSLTLGVERCMLTNTTLEDNVAWRRGSWYVHRYNPCKPRTFVLVVTCIIRKQSNKVVALFHVSCKVLTCIIRRKYSNKIVTIFPEVVGVELFWLFLILLCNWGYFLSLWLSYIYK